MALGDHLPVEGHLGQRFLGQVGGGVRQPCTEAGRQHGAVHGQLGRVQLTEHGIGPPDLLFPARRDSGSTDVFEGALRCRCQVLPVRGRGGESGLGEPPVGHRSGVVPCRRGQDRLGHQEIGEHVITGDGQGHQHLRSSAMKRHEVLGEPGPLLGGERSPSAADRGVVVQDADQGRQIEQFRVDAQTGGQHQRHRPGPAERGPGRGGQGIGGRELDERVDEPGFGPDARIEPAGREQVAEQGVAVGVEELPAVQPGQDRVTEVGLGAVGEQHEDAAGHVARQGVEYCQQRRAGGDLHVTPVDLESGRSVPDRRPGAADADDLGAPRFGTGELGADPLQDRSLGRCGELSRRHRRGSGS